MVINSCRLKTICDAGSCVDAEPGFVGSPARRGRKSIGSESLKRVSRCHHFRMPRSCKNARGVTTNDQQDYANAASKYPQADNKATARYREMAANRGHIETCCPRLCAANRLWKLSPPAPRGQLLSAGPLATLPVRPTVVREPHTGLSKSPKPNSQASRRRGIRRTGSPAGPSFFCD